MRLLFPEDPSIDEEGDGENGGDEEVPGGVSPEPPVVTKPKPTVPPPAQKFKTKLLDSMTKFFNQMSDSKFFRTGNATQLVQAAAFPVAVAAKGFDGKWIDNDTAANWVVKVAELLFSVELYDQEMGKHKGLLNLFRQKYKSQECEDTF